MSGKLKIKWLREPEEHDYPSALSYLSLLYKKKICEGYIAKLRRAPIGKFKAKDIFRASGLPLLNAGNSHVEKDRKKISRGQKLSPLLLVRGRNNTRLIIADGYHRICAVYSYDEDVVIPCKIV